MSSDPVSGTLGIYHHDIFERLFILFSLHFFFLFPFLILFLIHAGDLIYDNNKSMEARALN